MAVRDVTNPTITYGTGHFKLRIVKGTNNEFDYDYHFSQIGFTGNPGTPTASSISLVAPTNEPNKLGTFRITVSFATTLILDQSSIRIGVPQKITFDKSKVKVTTTPSLGTFTLAFYQQYIILSKITGQVTPASLTIDVQFLQNLPYADGTGDFSVELRSNGTQRMLDYVNLGPATIVSSVIPSDFFIISSFGQDVNSVNLYNADTCSIEFSVQIKNTLPDDCSIVLEFPSTFTPSHCWPLVGMKDLSETARITCTMTATQVIFKNIRSIYKEKEVSFGVKFLNPNTDGNHGPFKVMTFYDRDGFKAVDVTPNVNLYVTNTFPAPTVTVPTATLPSNTVLNDIEVAWTITDPIASMVPKVNLHGSFSNTAGATPLTCLLYKNAVLATTTTCTAEVNDKNMLEVNMVAFAGTAAALGDAFSLKVQKVAAGGILTPTYADEYFALVELYDAGNLVAGGSGFFSVLEKDFTPALVSIKAFTKDFSHRSVYDFSLYLPFALDQGQWSSKDQLALSYFELIFLKPGFDPIFLTDYPVNSKVPCYGAVGIRTFGTESDNNLKCEIKDNAVDNAYSIFVKGYNLIDSEGLVRIHIPGLYNPTNNTAGTVIVRVYRNYQRREKLILKTSVTMANAVNQDIFDNPRNTAGVDASTTNLSPEFVPNKINQPSYTDLKFTPSKPINAKGGLVIFFPKLPTTSPQYYILPPQKSIICKYGSVILSCYSYFEASTILIENLPAVPANNEAIIRITGFTNAPYVVDLHANVEMWSYSDVNIEVERFIYTDLAPLDYGSVNDAYVLPYAYQALKQDITYDWIFRLTNDVPENGKLVLYFPANYYDLESSVPCPTVELVQGLAWKDPANNPNVAAALTCNTIFATSIATVSQIKPVKRDDVIVIRFKGVKNPSQEGWTPYFQIETRNQENYIIDRIQTIPQVFITRKMGVLTVVFDGFYTSPDNGKLKGNYHLSFFPQTAIPKNGRIDVTFPAAEFDPALDWPATKVCKVGGSLKTFSKCVWSATQPLIQIYLDERLDIEPGMEPVRLVFPHIMNFNAELSSGVVKVTTSYDGLTLDESGSDESNRKAVTSKEARVLAVTSFDYYPRNEANVATYKFKFTPVVNVNSSAVIVLEFPYEFPKGLGENIVCRSPQLLISALDPPRCTVDEWRLNLTNHKGWTCADGVAPLAACEIEVEVFGIVNPNALPAVTTQIEVYIFVTSISVSEYSYGLGALAFVAAPPPIFEQWGAFSNVAPRKLANVNHLLYVTTAVTGATKVSCHFPKEFDLEVLSPALKIKSDPALAFAAAATSNNSAAVAQAYSLGVGVSKIFELQDLSQPYELGQVVPLYIIEFEDTALKRTLAKTYPNLISRSPITFATTEILITVNSDQYLYLEAGTYSDAIAVVAASAPPAQDIAISLSSNDPALDLNSAAPVVLKAGSTTAYFRLGYNLFTLTRKVWVKFAITAGKSNNGGLYFADIRPLKVVVYPSTQVAVKVSEFAALAAGGRSTPLSLYLDKGPFKQLTVGIFQLGRIPDMMSIYPKQLVFQPGEKKKNFWLSTDFSSKGSQGSVVFTLTGDTKSVYSFPSRQKDFYIYEGRDVPPVILFQQILGPTKDNSIKVKLVTDTHCTAYFALFPRGTLDITFTEIRRKRLRYDNFMEKYKLGEVVFANDQNLIEFELKDLYPSLDQTLKLFIQNTDGVVAEAIYYPFTTVKPQAPMVVYLQVTSDGSKAAILSSLTSGIASGSRIKAENPDDKFFFEEKKLGETVVPIPYPDVEESADLDKKKAAFLEQKNKQEEKPQAVATKTGAFGTINVGSSTSSAITTTSKTAGVADTDALKDLNQKTQSIDVSLDTGKSATTLMVEGQKVNKFRSKEVIPLVVGQEISSQDQ